MEHVNTVLFSDVHLGSPNARAYDLLKTLQDYRFKRLIINGDMFEDLNFKRLTSTHWELLEHIGKLSRRDVEVVWIEGNHDAKFIEFMSLMIGIPAHLEYEWEVNGRKFVALHGHQFDGFLTKKAVLGRLCASFYTWLQGMLSSSLFDLLALRIADKWLRATEQITRLAIDHAVAERRDVIVCGHTHFVHNIKEQGVEYFNSGCWNNTPSSLFIVQNDGSSQLKVIA
jgi:UDP-2,3-diacylglucosamine pyrophosphatase LpxH